MKKTIALLLIFVMMLGLLTGCKGKEELEDTPNNTGILNGPQETKEPDKVPEKPVDVEPEVPEEPPYVPQHRVIEINEAAENNNYIMTLRDLTFLDYTEFLRKPAEGNEFIQFRFAIDNHSMRSLMLYMGEGIKAYLDDEEISDNDLIYPETSVYGFDLMVMTGLIYEDGLCFEVPTTWNTLTMRFDGGDGNVTSFTVTRDGKATVAQDTYYVQDPPANPTNNSGGSGEKYHIDWDSFVLDPRNPTPIDWDRIDIDEIPVDILTEIIASGVYNVPKFPNANKPTQPAQPTPPPVVEEEPPAEELPDLSDIDFSEPVPEEIENPENN